MKDVIKTRRLVLNALTSAAASSGSKVAVLCVKKVHVDHVQKLAEEIVEFMPGVELNPGKVSFVNCDPVGGEVKFLVEGWGLQKKLENKGYGIILAYEKQESVTY